MWTYYTVHFRKLLRCNVPHCSLREATGMRLHCHPTIFTPWLQGTDWPAAESCTCIYTRCQHMIGWQVTTNWLVAKHHGSIDDLRDDIIKASWLAYSLHHKYKVKVDCAILSLHKCVYWVRSLPFSLFMYLKEKQYKIAMILLCPVQGPWASSLPYYWSGPYYRIWLFT